jgi:hypothetical protein
MTLEIRMRCLEATELAASSDTRARAAARKAPASHAVQEAAQAASDLAAEAARYYSGRDRYALTAADADIIEAWADDAAAAAARAEKTAKQETGR